MPTIRERVAILGYALVPYRGETGLSSEELGFQVARTARRMAGIPRQAVDSVHNSTLDLFDGVTISNGILQPAAGGYGRDCTRIQNGGAFAVISACAAILSQASEVAVVSSVDAVQTDRTRVTNFSTHPLLEQPLGAHCISSYALFATAYLGRKGLDPDLSARVAWRNYQAGSRNPDAHLRRSRSLEEIRRARVIASPLRSSEISLVPSYGGAALVLASEGAASRSPVRPVWISGWGMGTHGVDFSDQEDLPAVRRAAQAAYSAAGLSRPAQEIGAAELHSPFSTYELALAEALELCEPAQVANQVNAQEGPEINPSGGALCTNPANSGGLMRTVLAARALHSGWSRRDHALVHDSDISLGLGGDSHAVLILERGSA